jgi:hypothetical protein
MPFIFEGILYGLFAGIEMEIMLSRLKAKIAAEKNL